MNPDQKRLAEALAVRRMYGDSAEIHVAERIGALALERAAPTVSVKDLALTADLPWAGQPVAVFR